MHNLTLPACLATIILQHGTLLSEVGSTANTMEQGPSWEANSHSDNHENPPSMEHEVSLSCSQKPATGPYPEQDASNVQFPNLFL